MWIKQIPLNRTGANGVWDTRLRRGYRPVKRSEERPRQDVDAVTLSRLLEAANGVLSAHYDTDKPAILALHQALLSFDDRADKERRGQTDD